MKALKAMTLASAIALLPGCATIFSGDTATINLIASNGQETVAQIDGQRVMVPGAAVVKKSKDPKVIVVDTETCKGEATLKPKVEPTMWIGGIFVVYGLFSTTTDYATGAMWDYSDTVVINCE